MRALLIIGAVLCTADFVLAYLIKILVRKVAKMREKRGVKRDCK